MSDSNIVTEPTLSERLAAALAENVALKAANPDAAQTADLSQRANAAESENARLHAKLAAAEKQLAAVSARVSEATAAVVSTQKLAAAEARAIAAEAKALAADSREHEMRSRLHFARLTVFRFEHTRQKAAGADAIAADNAARALAFPELVEIERLMGPEFAAESNAGREFAEVLRLADKQQTPPEESAPKFDSYDAEVRARRASRA